MRSLMATTKALAKSFAILAALYLSLHHLADFSEKQSIALAFIAWAGYELYESLRASSRVTDNFSPFFVFVSPHWYELLRDYKLVQSHEEWQQIVKSRDSAPPNEYNVLRSGILFSVLQPRSDAYLPALIYWDSRRRFVSEVEFEEQIEEIHVENPTLKGHAWEWKPEVYFKGGLGGYEVGLGVNGKWWEQICAADETKELAKTKTDTDPFTGRTQLAVATLPYSEFDIYYHDVAYGSKRREKQRNRQLAQNGWKAEDLPDAEIEHVFRPPIRIDHKYFTVEHRHI
jgi:hypothetical protein